MTAAELAQSPLVVRERGSGTRVTLDRALQGHDRAAPALELGSNAAVRASVVAGSDPAVLSELAVTSELARGELLKVAVPELDLSRQIRAVWSSERLTTTAERLIGIAARSQADASAGKPRPGSSLAG